jgi:hypothetical protein
MTRVRVLEVGPTGAVIFTAPLRGHRERFYWGGPGSSVRLFWAESLLSLDALRGWPAMSITEARAQIREVSRTFEGGRS